MTSERTTAEPLEATQGGLPPLHFGALRRWLEAHPDRVPQAFEAKAFPRETHVFPARELSAGEAPRMMIVLSGELSLIQLFLGGLRRTGPSTRGDLWVNPNLPLGRKAGLARPSASSPWRPARCCC